MTKKGGWVIAAGVRDWGLTPKHPECPIVEKMYEGHVRYHQSLLARYLSGETTPGRNERQLTEHHYIDLHSGRKCGGWFETAGLTDLVAQANVSKLDQSVMEHFGLSIMFHLPPENDSDDPVWDIYRDIIAEGFLDEETITQARQEVEAWFNDPYAFLCPFTMSVAGRA